MTVRVVSAPPSTSSSPSESIWSVVRTPSASACIHSDMTSSAGTACRVSIRRAACSQ